MPKNHLIPLALNISERTYTEFVYNRGLDWIETKMSLNDEEITYTIAKSELFWKWWKNQWNLRDEKFCSDINILRQELPLDGMELKAAREIYLEVHAVVNIRVIPNRYVVGDVGRLLKEQIEKEKQIIKTI